ncbi:sigma-70 family RNA polymerase sigma factor [bacterium]|nr:sigma-70 family RNA polymerase sigma factor [bacterium]
MTVTDDKLMEQISSGQEAAFRLLVQRWESPLFGFLWRMTGSEDDARDLCQDTFVTVYSRSSEYKPEGKFKSWLFRIAGNSARSFLRRRKIIGWVSFDSTKHDRSENCELPDAEVSRNQQVKILQAAVDKLPPRQKQALVLKRYQQLSQKEVAEVMQISESAVESLLVRALTQLRKQIGRSQ